MSAPCCSTSYRRRGPACVVSKARTSKGSGNVRVSALAMASASNDAALEQIVGRLSLEPQVSGASWEVDRSLADG